MTRPPRLEPLTDAEMSPEAHELTNGYRVGDQLYNVFRIAVRHLRLFKSYKSFGLFTQVRSSLEPRHRELAILRIAYLNRSDYEWGHHARIAMECGLAAAEVERVKAGADAPDWQDFDRVILRAVDQLKFDTDLDDEIYAALSAVLTEIQLTDLIYTVGNYAMVSTALKVFGVPLEEGVHGIDAPVRALGS